MSKNDIISGSGKKKLPKWEIIFVTIGILGGLIVLGYFSLMALATTNINNFKIAANNQIADIKNESDEPVTVAQIPLLNGVADSLFANYHKVNTELSGQYGDLYREYRKYNADLIKFNTETNAYNESVGKGEKPANGKALQDEKTRLANEQTKINDKLKSLQDELNNL